MRIFLTMLCLTFLASSYGQGSAPNLLLKRNEKEGFKKSVPEIASGKGILELKIKLDGQVYVEIGCASLDSLMLVVPKKYNKVEVIVPGFDTISKDISNHLVGDNNRNEGEKGNDNQEPKNNYAIINFLQLVAKKGKGLNENDAQEIYCGVLQSSVGVTLKFSGETDSYSILLAHQANEIPPTTKVNGLTKIDPRRYVTVYEKQRDTAEAIWWLKSIEDGLQIEKYNPEESNGIKQNKFISKQKYESVDEKAVLEIRFDQEMLAQNLEFYGNISLAATLDNVPIEVAPYAMIGENRSKYGVKNEPIKEIAAHFLNLFIEAQNAQEITGVPEHVPMESDDWKWANEYLTLIKNQLYNQLENRWRNSSKIPLSYVDTSVYRTSDNSGNAKIKKLIKEKKEGLKLSIYSISEIENSEEDNLNAIDKTFILRLKKEQGRYNAELDAEILQIGKHARDLMEVLKSDNEAEILTTQLEKLIKLKPETENLMDILESVSNTLIGQTVDTSMIPKNGGKPINSFSSVDQAKFDRYLSEVGLVIQYMEYFKKAGDEGIRAFLSLAEITKIRFDTSLKILKQNYKTLSGLPSLSSIPAGHSDWWKYVTAKSSIDNELHYLASRNKKFLKVDKGPQSHTLSAADQETYSIVFPKKMNVSEQEYNEIPKKVNTVLKNHFIHFQEEIAEAAGKIIFNKMLYATIDLQKANAQPDQVLEIFVVWKNITPNMNETDGEEANENDKGANDEYLLPAGKFKVLRTGWHLAFPESAFLVQRLNEDLVSTDVSPSNFKPTAGISMVWSYHNDLRGQKLNKFFRWLEPSFGINVSYADFTTAKDYEVAVGPVMGLWGNRVLLTGGYNFSIAGQSPFYVGFGLSFSNIINHIEIQK